MNTDALGQDAEIDLLRSIAPLLKHKTFIDVGAEKGAIAKALFTGGLTGTLFEPLPRHVPGLQQLVNENAGSVVYPWAISDADGERDLHIATDSEGRELDYFHSLQPAKSEGVFDHQSVLKVTCRSLKSLHEEGLIPADIGILKTDTEGNDLAVLRGLGPIRPELVVCEYFTQGLYDGWQDGDPMLAIQLMQHAGYSYFYALRRIEGYEFSSLEPREFLYREWGNLFFFSDSVFSLVRSTLTGQMSRVAARNAELHRTLFSELQEKERVIQELAAALRAEREKNLRLTSTLAPTSDARLTN